MSKALDWDGDWLEITSETERRELEEELLRELAPCHVLHGIHGVAVGRRFRRDDVLFRLPDGRYAQVHLTRRPERNADWPSADVYDSFAEWKAVPLEDR